MSLMKYVLAGWGIILVVFLIVLSRIPIGIEPLTELYFNDHQDLPGRARIGDIYNVSFTIRNLEYKSMSYPYAITESYGNITRTIAEGSAELADNTSIAIPFSFSFNESFARAMVQVTLAGSNQSIHLWVDETQ